MRDLDGFRKASIRSEIFNRERSPMNCLSRRHSSILSLNHCRAFTLIEILVVISIIAVLMGILMPALTRVRTQGQSAICRANLRSWGMICRMYADEHNGKFAPGNRVIWARGDWVCSWWCSSSSQKEKECQIGYALEFDGSGDYITFDDSGLPKGDAPRTMSLWLKPKGEGVRVALDWGTHATAQRSGILLLQAVGAMSVGQKADVRLILYPEISCCE